MKHLCLLVCLLARLADAQVYYFNDFAMAPDDWQAVAPNGTRATWERGQRNILLETKTKAEAIWRAPSLDLPTGQYYKLAIRYKARSEEMDTGMYRLAIAGAKGTPKAIDEIIGSYNAPGTDLRFPDLGYWTVKRFWFAPAHAKTDISIRTLTRYTDQTMWFDDFAIVGAASHARLMSPRDGDVVSTATPTLKWQAPFDLEPTESYVLVMAMDERLKKYRRTKTIKAMRFTVDKPLQEGVWFWTVYPTPPANAGRDRRVIEYASEVRSLRVYPAPAHKTADTTPPHIYCPQPLPDSTIEPGHTWLTFRMRDDGGSGVDVNSLKILLNDRSYLLTGIRRPQIREDEVRIGWSADPDTANPPRWRTLEPGIYRVDVTVADKAGNVGHKTWQFGIGENIAPKTHFDDEGRTICNGLPFFPISVYFRGDHQPFFMDLVDNGCNTFLNWHTFCATFGAKSLPGLMHEFRNNADEAAMRAKLITLTDKLKDSNAVLGYWLNETHDKHTARGFEILRELDPHHFALFSEGWGFADYGHTSDGYFYNDYAVPVRPITSQMARQQAAEAARKPGQTIWYINQGWDHATYTRRPLRGTRAKGFDWRPHGREMRAMAHLGMIDGAMGLNWWAPVIDLDGEAYSALLDQFREFTWAGPVYWSSHPAEMSTVKVDGGKRRFVMKRREQLYFAERQTKDARYIMAVNVDTVPLTATFTVPGMTDGVSVQVMSEDRIITATAGIFSDVFAGPQAHVYHIAQ